MTRRRSFPPSAGWIPVTAAVAIALAVSIGAFAPQWGSRITGTRLEGGSSAGAGGGTEPTAGTAVDDPGALVGGAGAAGGNGSAKAGASRSAVLTCKAGSNGGPTDTGVTASEIRVATTDVTSGIGAGFLGQAAQGIQAAINRANNAAGGVCGRRVVLDPPLNDGWDPAQGQVDIENFISSKKYFALVGEPDSEGLRAALLAGDIDRAQIPVVGTDGMLGGQYMNPWVWPVAASTVSNMHIAVKYAKQQGWATKASDFAIVYDTKYKFGKEGAAAYNAEVEREFGGSIPGASQQGCPQGTQYCGINAANNDYTTEKNAFNSACEPATAGAPSNCKVVVVLLEPGPALTWITKDEGKDQGWYVHLVGGEPLFDYNFGYNCGRYCYGMMVWSGYHPDIQPFDSEKEVYTYAQALKAACPSCDPQNEFTEGAYLGTRLFIEACVRVNSKGLPLTRQNLKQELDSDTFDLGLSMPLHFGTKLPRVANVAMVGYSDNSGGSFNGWSYNQTGFISDPAPGKDVVSD